LEQPAARVALGEVAPAFGETVADGCGRAVAVVGQRVGHDRDAARAITLVADLLESRAGELPRPPLDRVLDPIGRHVDLTGLLDREPEPEIPVWVAPALARGDRDLTAGASERLAPLGVDDGLFVLDAGPFRMAGHQLHAPNMLSMILAQPHSNETSFPGLQDVSIPKGGVGAGLLPVDADTPLLDQ